jgi:hypothetical protein
VVVESKKGDDPEQRQGTGKRRSERITTPASIQSAGLLSHEDQSNKRIDTSPIDDHDLIIAHGSPS